MMPIASVLHLDRKAVKALRITDAYSLHRVVYSLYDDVRSDAEKSASCASGIQYADMGGDFHGRKILMLADRQPAPHLTVDTGEQYGEVQSRAVPADFLSHGRYRFKVIVNPTRRDNQSRKLVPIKGRDAISQWFIERAVSSWGFTVVQSSLQVDAVNVLQFQEKNKRQITLAQAHMQGELIVEDRTRFQNSFLHGIGRGRTFGCGLLQLAPISNVLFE